MPWYPEDNMLLNVICLTCRIVELALETYFVNYEIWHLGSFTNKVFLGRYSKDNFYLKTPFFIKTSIYRCLKVVRDSCFKWPKMLKPFCHSVLQAQGVGDGFTVQDIIKPLIESERKINLFLNLIIPICFCAAGETPVLPHANDSDGKGIKCIRDNVLITKRVAIVFKQIIFLVNLSDSLLFKQFRGSRYTNLSGLVIAK